MPEPQIHRSRRFAKAARAERDRLARRRSQIFKKRQSLQGKVDQLDEELEAVDQEINRLDELAGDGVVAMREADDGQASVLSGSAIRTLAVPLLLREQGTAPIHYRAWLERLSQRGYAVAGKRPDAVFLNQVVRSPLVRATTKAGYYEIDLEAMDQLRATLRRQKSELAQFMREAPTEIGAAFDRHQEHQRVLNAAVARTERELNEATSAIKAGQASEDLSETMAA